MDVCFALTQRGRILQKPLGDLPSASQEMGRVGAGGGGAVEVRAGEESTPETVKGAELQTLYESVCNTWRES